MELKRPGRATRAMGRNQSEFNTLWIRDEVCEFSTTDNKTYHAARMVCCFKPTAEELAALNAGGLVYLSIMGTQFPPVLVTVGDPNPEITYHDEP